MNSDTSYLCYAYHRLRNTLCKYACGQKRRVNVPLAVAMLTNRALLEVTSTSGYVPNNGLNADGPTFNYRSLPGTSGHRWQNIFGRHNLHPRLPRSTHRPDVNLAL